MIRVDGRKPDEMRPVKVERGYLKHAEGSALISVGDTRVLCAASIEEKVPPFLRRTPARAGSPPSTRCCRARPTPASARESSRGQGRRAHPRDPAPDRALAAGGDRHGRPRRAHRLGRLRRHPGRRRHPHRVDHRRLRRAARWPLLAASRGQGRRELPAGRPRGRGQRRHRRRRAAARPVLRGGLARRGGHERRHDRSGQARRGPGHGRGRALLVAPRARGAAGAGRARGIDELVALQRRGARRDAAAASRWSAPDRSACLDLVLASRQPQEGRRDRRAPRAACRARGR